MEILIENKTPNLPKAASTATFSRRRDMPRTIAALPPRLRMKILCRSEQNFEDFHQIERDSPHSGFVSEIIDDVHPSCEAISTDTLFSPNQVIACDFSQQGENAGKEPAVTKIVVRKPCQEKGIEQRNNVLAALSLFDDHFSEFGRNIEGAAVERAVPSWFEKSLTKNKSILSTLQELPKLNKEVWQIIDKQNYFQGWMEFKKVRQSLQKIFIRLLETNLTFCCKENIELYFWKVLFYHAIECFKKLLKACTDQVYEILQQVTLELIAEGVGFYQSLLEILKNCHSFAIDSTSPEDNSDLLARISAQKIYLNLGDLARYEEQIVGGNNFFKAKELYHTARILIPTNGIPYNQLAILAIYSKRKFDAIYYHMRSLTASNPIQSAKESLKELFDEIRKKYDSQVDTKMLEKEDAQKSCYKLAPIRKEIWIHPSGSRRLYRITPYSSKQLYYLDERALKELPCDELNKRFQLSYLCAIGKLYTRIGMENFNRILFQMLSEFKEAIERGSFLFNKHRLLQIIALNIFAIECNTGASYEDNRSARTEMKNHAFNVSSLIFGTILNRANELLTVLVSTEETPIDRLSSELVVLLQAIKVWCDWLALNLPSWIPLPSISNYSLVNEYEMNPWDGFAEIITLLSSISRDNEVELDELYASKLEEDVFLDGFTPITPNTKCPIRSRRCDKTIEGIFRIKKLILFGSTFLCHCSPPILKRIAHDGKEFFINISSGPENSAAEDIDQPEFKEVSPEKEGRDLEEGAWSASSEGGQSDLVAENPEVEELIKRKQELEERRKMEETYQQNLQDILRKFGKILHIEVRPKYLVPDTNCFIDSLQELQLIANDFKHYTLAVPLVVVNELEGLSKGFKPTSLSLLQLNRSKIHHFDEVSSSASRALQFIRGKNLAVKCVTSKGSFLNTSSFTYEETSDSYQSNDDKILATALNLCKINIEVRDDGQHAVSTTVVLLTTDRNLRVKALSKNLPVSELQEFLRWAKMDI